MSWENPFPSVLVPSGEQSPGWHWVYKGFRQKLGLEKERELEEAGPAAGAVRVAVGRRGKELDAQTWVWV